jgi:hypothetical protein
MLPAFLSFYLGCGRAAPPPAPTRALQGLLVGALVTVGFLGFFALVGLLRRLARLHAAALLTLVGASITGGGKLTTFLAYGTGMAVVLMALSVLVALAREGAARAVRPLLPQCSPASASAAAAPSPQDLCGNDPARAHRTGACALGRRLQRRQERRTETPTVESAAESTTSGAPGPRQLTDLRDVGQLRSLFNTRSHEPRLILLLSPT